MSKLIPALNFAISEVSSARPERKPVSLLVGVECYDDFCREMDDLFLGELKPRKYKLFGDKEFPPEGTLKHYIDDTRNKIMSKQSVELFRVTVTFVSGKLNGRLLLIDSLEHVTVLSSISSSKSIVTFEGV